MRKIYDNSGTDVTAATQAVLRTSKTVVLPFLYRFQPMIFWGFNPYGGWGDFCFTDAAFPIFINKYQVGPGAAVQIGSYSGNTLNADGQTFLPESIRFDNLTYGIGFEDHPCEISWAIDDARDYGVVFTGIKNYSVIAGIASPVNTTLKQALLMGAFQEVPFWIHQAIYSDFPSQGGTFLGSTLMFRGFIRKVDATRSTLKIGLSSLMDVFQQVQLPVQTLTPNNRAVPFIPAAGSSFQFTAGHAPVVVTPTLIKFQCAASVAAGALKDAWVSFCPALNANTGLQYQSGKASAPAWRVENNLSTASTGDGYCWVYFYEPPIVPSNPAAGPANLFMQTSLTGGAPGFKFIPPPEFSA